MSIQVPPECQTIAEELEATEAQRREKQAELKELVGNQKVPVLAEIKKLSAKINELRSKLDSCILSQPGGYEADVTVIDLGGTTVPPYIGRMWRLTPPSTASIVEARTVNDGRLKFANSGTLADASSAVSIHDDPASVFPGALFRSGPFASLPGGTPGDPAGAIEILVPTTPPPVTGPAMTASLPPLPMPVGSAGPASTTITSLTPTPGAGSLSLMVGGTAVLSFGFFGSATIPFTYTLALTIAPSLSMNDTTEVCVVNALGPGILAATGGGFFGAMLNIFSSFIEPAIRMATITAVQSAVNASLLAAIAGAIGLAVLPAGVVVSMRRVVMTAGGIGFQPAIGAYGGLFTKIPPP